MADGPLMRVAVYRTDPPALLAALSDGEFLQRWLSQQEDDLKSLVERALVAHIRQLTTVASRILAEGLERVAEQDTAAVDAYLSDAFAVATWHRWELPVEPLGELDVPVETLPRGLLAADRSREGAQVWLLDPHTVAIARNRAVTEVV